MKFTLHSKELNKMLERAGSAIYKKAAFQSIRNVYFQVNADGTVSAMGTNMEHWIRVKTENAYNTSPGTIGLSIDDFKVLSKMNGEITLQYDGDSGKISIKCGKKVVNIPAFENDDIVMPSLDSEKIMMTLKESWLLETITNLSLFVRTDDYNKMLACFCLNTSEGRIEALNGSVIGTRALKDDMISDNSENVLLHSKCLPVFKKNMDKNSDEEIRVYQDKKYVKIEGKDFEYIIRRVDGVYFKTNQFFTYDYNYRFSPDRDDILEIIKYAADFSKGHNAPFMIHAIGKELYFYYSNGKYEILDSMEILEMDMNEYLFVGFNPNMLVDIFSIVDSTNPICRGNGSTGGLIVDGDEYRFFILPIRIGDSDMENMMNQINKNEM